MSVYRVNSVNIKHVTSFSIIHTHKHVHMPTVCITYIMCNIANFIICTGGCYIKVVNCSIRVSQSSTILDLQVPGTCLQKHHMFVI